MVRFYSLLLTSVANAVELKFQLLLEILSGKYETLWRANFSRHKKNLKVKLDQPTVMDDIV